MTWEEFRQNDMREQQQLEIARALIEDATRETVLRLQANPSAEERVHVSALQERLADLDRIVARRMERRVSPRDSWEWSENVSEVLSLLEKLRELRIDLGQIVAAENGVRDLGKRLARLAEHLPRSLPGHEPNPEAQKPVHLMNTAFTPVTKAPAPPKEVGGFGVTHTPDWEKPSRVPHDPPTYFSGNLWPQTNVILLKAQRNFPLQTQILKLCEHVIREMTPLFCEAVNAGKMTANEVLSERLGGMADLLRAICQRNYGSSSLGGLSDRAYQFFSEIRDSDEWLGFSNSIAEVDRLRTERKQTDATQQETRHARNSDKIAQNVGSDRRAMVGAYIEEVRTKKGKRITKKDIWTAAGYQTRTEFERWERQDSKHPNKAAHENFTRILREKPHLK